MTDPNAVNPRAGKPASEDMLVDTPRLVTAYFALQPDVSVPAQRVAFGTSGHRGSSFDRTFNEWHVAAIAQAICESLCGEFSRRRAPAAHHRGGAADRQRGFEGRVMFSISGIALNPGREGNR